MYFCNFFVQWNCSLHWSSLWNCCSQSAFALLSPSPSCCRALVAHSLQVTAGFMWKMVSMFPLHHYRFALWIFCKFYPQKDVSEKNTDLVYWYYDVPCIRFRWYWQTCQQFLNTPQLCARYWAQSLKPLSSHKSHNSFPIMPCCLNTRSLSPPVCRTFFLLKSASLHSIRSLRNSDKAIPRFKNPPHGSSDHCLQSALILRTVSHLNLTNSQ